MRTRTGYGRERIRRTVNKRWFSISMLGAIFIVIVVGSWSLLRFEKPKNPDIQTYGEAVWVSFVTMTTVGYGDAVPVTPGGRASVIVMMALGVSLLTGFIGTVASAKAEKALRRAKGLDQKTTLHDHFVVCGWNQRGRYVLQRLAGAAKGSGAPVALLCTPEDNPFENDFVFFYHGSPTSVADQKRVNMHRARSAILLADEVAGGDPNDVDARTVLCALTARSLNPGLHIVAEVLEPENVEHLTNAGVEEVFDHNLIGGSLLAQSALRRGVIDLVNAMAEKDADEKMRTIPVPDELVGMTCGEASARLSAEYGYRVVGFRKVGALEFCGADAELDAGDEVMVLLKE